MPSHIDQLAKSYSDTLISQSLTTERFKEFIKKDSDRFGMELKGVQDGDQYTSFRIRKIDNQLCVIHFDPTEYTIFEPEKR